MAAFKRQTIEYFQIPIPTNLQIFSLQNGLIDELKLINNINAKSINVNKYITFSCNSIYYKKIIKDIQRILKNFDRKMRRQQLNKF